MDATSNARQAPAATLRLHGRDSVLFGSDMHLGEHDPDTAQYFMQALSLRSVGITHLILLGDVFEAWVGDDQQDPVADGLITRLAQLTRAGVWVGIMRGNRDFLLNVPLSDRADCTTGFAARCGAHMLADPTVIEGLDEPVLITHGDAWCLSDTDYQQFRTQVRAPAWQANFLARPLGERQAIARAMRHESEQRREISDIDSVESARVMHALRVYRLIHGHTHQPGASTLAAPATGRGIRRWVLPDWSALDRRGGFLRLDASGIEMLDAGVA